MLVRLLGLVVVVQPLRWFFLALFFVVVAGVVVVAAAAATKNLIKVLAVFWGTTPTTFCGLEGDAIVMS